ncbi:hypothetical protein AMAG_14408 [Allomyces macrogynus ATCC 38327]|uniref:G-protein coupled receptors family 3 profile domain-containing protein n=1 Tax=Allomyces macrogynus (strain ATCC 38327) TaxID=578462 RepID=A0A0L0T672_ALLM3|nr:hypothetical protein AMAG_14408 [Allomyces macrogynus ATCC 38327]|eukprot:KNE70257.1 hypothetical protein AMAG_14408 [Allomyces macrogynus ATCC 38327]
MANHTGRSTARRSERERGDHFLTTTTCFVQGDGPYRSVTGIYVLATGPFGFDGDNVGRQMPRRWRTTKASIRDPVAVQIAASNLAAIGRNTTLFRSSSSSRVSDHRYTSAYPRRLRAQPWSSRLATLTLVFALALFTTTVTAVTTVRLFLAPATPGQEAEQSSSIRPLLDAWESTSGIHVELVWNSGINTNERLVQAQAAIGTGQTSSVDVLIYEYHWAGILANSLIDVSPLIPASELHAHDPRALAGITDWPKVMGLPVSTSYTLLYYRSDLLAKYGFSGPPRTWSELEVMAETITSGESAIDPTLIGYLPQFMSNELLTTNLLEYLAGSDAGALLEPDRTLSSFTTGSKYAAVLRVAQRVRKWVTSAVVDATAVVADEMVSGMQWGANNVVMMRFSPIVPNRIVPRGTAVKWNATLLPGEKVRGASTLSGVAAGVVKGAANMTAAAQVVRLLGSATFQKAMALQVGVMPAVPSLLNDPDVCREIMFCDVYKNVTIMHRPSLIAGEKYSQVSQAIYTQWSGIISGQATPEVGIDNMNRQIATILGIDLLGNPTNPTWTDPVVITMVTIGLGGAIGLIATSVLLYQSRAAPKIQRAPWSLLNVMQMGMAIALVHPLVMAGVPNSVTCVLQPWQLVTSHTLMVGGAALRLFRCRKMFRNVFAKHIVVLRDRTVVRVMLALIAVDTFLFAIWTGIDPPQPVDVKRTTWRYMTCKSQGDAAGIPVFVFHGGLHVAALILAARSHPARKVFPDAQALALGVYNTTLLMALVLPTRFFDAIGLPIQYAATAVALFLTTGVFYGLFIFPHLRTARAFRRGERSSSGAGAAASAEGRRSPSSGGGAGRASGSAAESGPGLKRKTSGAAALVRPAHAANTDRVGLVSYCVARSRWWLPYAAWQGAKMHLFPGLGMLVLEPTDSADPRDTGHVIDLASITAVDATDLTTREPNSTTPAAMDSSMSLFHEHVFRVTTTLIIVDIMAASPGEAAAWVEALALIRAAHAAATAAPARSPNAALRRRQPRAPAVSMRVPGRSSSAAGRVGSGSALANAVGGAAGRGSPKTAK